MPMISEAGWKYINNAVFTSVMNIYGPWFFIYGPPVLFENSTEGSYNETLNSHGKPPIWEVILKK